MAGPKGPMGAALYAALKGPLFHDERRVLDGEKGPVSRMGGESLMVRKAGLPRWDESP
jgi:hypothetical protein